jgi:glycosyltransferase involved in cell wall biosynthesis
MGQPRPVSRANEGCPDAGTMLASRPGWHGPWRPRPCSFVEDRLGPHARGTIRPVSRANGQLKVAMTLEQCWHRVPGGTAVAGIGMARSLAAGGDVDVIGVSARHSAPPPPEWRPQIAVASLPLPRVLLYEAWHCLRRPSVERATGRVDIVHATTLAVPPRSAPLVVTIHDVAFLHQPSHFTRRGHRFFRRGLELARRDADLILCPSETTADDCGRHGFDRARVRVVPMGIDRPVATKDEIEEVRDRHGLWRPYLLWVGTIEPRKNLVRLIEAFATLDHDLDLALAGPAGWNQDLERLLAGMRDRVRILGFVPERDLAALYGGATVFCFPSLLEGFGFPVLEAMAQGTPVVTSSGTSTEEIAGGAAVLVDPRDTDSIADGIRSVLDDESLAVKLSEGGPGRAARFSWERTAEELVNVYREVAA